MNRYSRTVLFIVLFVFVGALAFVNLWQNTSVSTNSDDILPTHVPTPTPHLGARIEENYRQGRFIQSLFYIQQIAQTDGWSPDLKRLAGTIWRDMGDKDRALFYWESIVLTSNDSKFIREVAATQIELQRWKVVRDTLSHLLSLSPDDHWANFQYGLLLAPFNPLEARQYLKQIASDSPFRQIALVTLFVLENEIEDPLISMRIGLVLADAQLWEKAELAFRHAADVGYPFPEALAYLGLMRDQQGKDGSLQIEQALELDVNNPQVRYLQGLHLRTKGDYVASLEALVLAARLDPENPGLYAAVGEAYQLIGDLEQAEYWLQFSVSLSGKAREYEDLLANFYAEEAYRDPQTVITELAQLVQTRPDSPDALVAFGWALHSTGDSQTGLTQINAALELDPNHEQGRFNKAQILLEIGLEDEARTLLNEIVVSDSPFVMEAQRLLATLVS